MNIEVSEDNIKVFEALASPIRIKIIQLLAKNKMNIKEIAEQLNLSSAIITMHIKKLEKAHIIKSEKIGQQKISSLQVEQIQIEFPKKIFNAFDTMEYSIPVGQFTSYKVKPTCGIATETDFIGPVDEPKYFMDPKRTQAQLLWFTEGFVEYQLPNYLQKDQKLEMLEISLELSSEFPFSNDNWPSDITFSMNNKELLTWTSPGDFADIRGKYTPNWYPDNLNQYGLLKTIRIMEQGTSIEGKPINSEITLKDIDFSTDIWNFKIEVKEDAQNIGGCTIFGEKFGNYDQNIKFKLFYS